MTNREYIIKCLGGITFNSRIKLTAENMDILPCWCEEPEQCELYVRSNGFEIQLNCEDDICLKCKNDWLNMVKE